MGMSIYDCFFDSIAGMHAAERYLGQAASYIANPGNWGMDSSSSSIQSADTSFSSVLANAMGQQGAEGGYPGNGGNPAVYQPPAGNALEGLGVGEGQGPNSLLDAMVLALMAQRMYEANARMFAIENKIVGIIIHLGEENYRPES